MIVDSTVFNANTDLEAQWIGYEYEVPVPDDAITTKHGRKVFRHPNDRGFVIVYDNWGIESQMFISRHRGKKAFDTSPTRHDIFHTGTLSREYVNGNADDRKKPLPYVMTDADIQRAFPELANCWSAQKSTDVLYKRSTCDAAKYAKENTDDGRYPSGFALPNLYQAIIIYLEADTIDSLAPDDNTNWSLGIKNPSGRLGLDGVTQIWTTTGSNSSTLIWDMSGSGHLHNHSQSDLSGCVIIKELLKND